jgi:hypothetical protein
MFLTITDPPKITDVYSAIGFTMGIMLVFLANISLFILFMYAIGWGLSVPIPWQVSAAVYLIIVLVHKTYRYIVGKPSPII